MDFLRNFIKEGYLKAVNNLPDYKIILGATAYFDKGILTEDDLKEINEALNADISAEEIIVPEITKIEETPTDILL